MRRLASLAATGALLGGAGAGASTATAAPPLSHWLSWNARKHTVRLLLVAGYDGTNNGFNFDGYARGRMLVTVPLGWRLTVVCRNAGPGYNSCAVVHGAQSGAIAFHGAATPRPAQGLSPGSSAAFTFRASRVGVYRLVSLVPGHELARQYDVLEIARSRRPRIELLSPLPG